MKKRDFNREEFIKLNNADRMWFIKFWAEYVRTHSDKDWSEQQKVLIDSQFQNSANYPLTTKQYLEIKEEMAKLKLRQKR